MSVSQLTAPIEGILATPVARLPYQHDVLLRTYVLQRPRGNTLIYNSPGITEARDEILDLGVPERLLINHAHEGMYGRPMIDIPVWAHQSDAPELSSLRLSGTFDRRHSIDDDLEAIPTPGHTSGTTSYLWDNGAHRFLFTGDFIWIEDGEWKAVVLDEGLRDEYLASLALVRDLDFDVLVPWGITEGDALAVVDTAEKRDRVQDIIDRVAGGSTR